MKALYGKFRALPTATQIALVVAATAIVIVAVVTEHTDWLKSAVLFVLGM